MKTNSQIRQESLASIKGHWGKAVLSCIVFILIALAIASPDSIYQVVMASTSPWLSGGTSILVLLIIYPLTIGCYNAFRLFRQSGDDSFTHNMFAIGFKNYCHNLGGMLLYALFVFLWTLLLIVPGIIMSLAYFCVPFLLADEPELTPMEAIRKSRAMTRGHKMDLFLMMLGFLGLSLLSILTLGIALLWLAPFMYNTFAGFYLELKEEYGK